MSPDESLKIYVDGSCISNPGPAAIAVLICRDPNELFGEKIGNATNNIAELKAIEYALNLLQDNEKNVTIYSDSQYCIGVLTKDWNPKVNMSLINSIKYKLQKINCEFVKVKAHGDNKENKIVDKLAYKLASEEVEC